jgi:transcriptional regulator
MYLPNWFREERLPVLQALMRQYGFATLITAPEGVPFASHLPFLLDPERGEFGALRAHMARANPQWQHFREATEVLTVFQGPHAYISPLWYANQPSVPTWNYAVVHAYGTPRLLNEEELYAALRDLIAGYEPQPDALNIPEAFARGQMNAIVGFEIVIQRLEGKFKLSQNRPATDRRQVIAALEQSNAQQEREIAARMRDNLG